MYGSSQLAVILYLISWKEKWASIHLYYIQYFNRSRGKFTTYVYVYVGALQYTTAHLQVLFSSQHLRGITKN